MNDVKNVSAGKKNFFHVWARGAIQFDMMVFADTGFGAWEKSLTLKLLR